MKVVAYLRVSTHEQAENGLGLEIQEHGIRQWASSSQHEVVAVHHDAGVSGSNGIDGRTGLAEVIATLRAQDAEALVVYRLDRLARDLIVQETLLAELRRIPDVRVFSTFPSEDAYLTDDPADPSRKMIRQILGAVSEYERAMTVLRLRSGRVRKARNGGYIGGSPRHPKYGQHLVEYSDGDGRAHYKYVPNHEQRERIQTMRRLRDNGATLQAIADHMSERNYEPPSGKAWYPATVMRILNREARI